MARVRKRAKTTDETVRGLAYVGALEAALAQLSRAVGDLHATNGTDDAALRAAYTRLMRVNMQAMIVLLEVRR